MTKPSLTVGLLPRLTTLTAVDIPPGTTQLTVGRGSTVREGLITSHWKYRTISVPIHLPTGRIVSDVPNPERKPPREVSW